MQLHLEIPQIFRLLLPSMESDHLFLINLNGESSRSDFSPSVQS